MSVLKFMGRVPWWVSWVYCHCAIVPSWGFHESDNFSRGYFVGLNFFLMGVSWVQNFFSWVFHGYELFSRGYFVGPKFFRVDFSWVHFFIVANNVIQKFSVVCLMRKSDRKQKYINSSQALNSIPNQLSVMCILERYFIYLISYAITKFSCVLIVF